MATSTSNSSATAAATTANMTVRSTPAGQIAGTRTPALCVDFDGTIRRSKRGPGAFIDGPHDIELFPDVEARLHEYRDKGWLILGITNQGGVAHGHKTVWEAEIELDATLALFVRSPFHLVKQCYHEENGHVAPWNIRSLLRKPSIGMLALMEVEAFQAGYVIDWDLSLFVGDRIEDKECADNAGMEFAWASVFFNRVPEAGQ